MNNYKLLKSKLSYQEQGIVIWRVKKADFHGCMIRIGWTASELLASY